MDMYNIDTSCCMIPSHRLILANGGLCKCDKSNWSQDLNIAIIGSAYSIHCTAQKHIWMDYNN